MAGREAPILTVSVAAELAGMHPQTVRQYDRLGLVPAHRTQGGGRRYSLADVDKLIEIQELSQNEGINLAGISRILELSEEVESLKKQIKRLRSRIAQQELALEEKSARENRVFAAGRDGDVMMVAEARRLREHLRQQLREEQEEDLPRHEIVVWHPLRFS